MRSWKEKKSRSKSSTDQTQLSSELSGISYQMSWASESQGSSVIKDDDFEHKNPTKIAKSKLACWKTTKISQRSGMDYRLGHRSSRQDISGLVPALSLNSCRAVGQLFLFSQPIFPPMEILWNLRTLCASTSGTFCSKLTWKYLVGVVEKEKNNFI